MNIVRPHSAAGIPTELMCNFILINNLIGIGKSLNEHQCYHQYWIIWVGNEADILTACDLLYFFGISRSL